MVENQYKVLCLFVVSGICVNVMNLFSLLEHLTRYFLIYDDIKRPNTFPGHCTELNNKECFNRTSCKDALIPCVL